MTALDSRFADDAESTGLLLWRVTNRWQAAQRAALKPFGLTHVQFVLLAALTWRSNDGPMTQRALADAAATDPMMTSQVLRTLEATGQVTRARHPDDRRAMLVTVTAAGIDLVNRAIGTVESVDDEFFGRLASAAPAFHTGLGMLARQPVPPGQGRLEG
ncbi:MarR family winged helix-turn-helix transcriptional regulator [Lacisediminihabitans sp.]|jgi:DNA-binding MarR family transcriptional regulator|uniref:MarR family winged helix-turn-helix transcriptional regulator n=1 Tax=Lacisediminihabitans sp. TaxID=2787631 RepID=UPI002F9368FF